MSEVKKIVNQNGEKIHVEVFVPDVVKGSVVFCHGITGCRKGRTMDDDYFQRLASEFQQRNYKAILFDFSGHGESEGNDFDVTLSKSTDELERVIEKEVDASKDIKFIAFSYGATVLSNYLAKHVEINPSKIVLFSPCFFPIESCFLSKKSIFGKDIVAAQENGELEKQGFAVVGAKNFKFGSRMLEDCKDFAPQKYKEIKDRVLVLSGRQDVILETKYNEDFCRENGIEMKWFDASHSLFEDIENVFDVVLGYFEI